VGGARGVKGERERGVTEPLANGIGELWTIQWGCVECNPSNETADIECVHQNASGMYRRIVRMHSGLSIRKKIVKFSLSIVEQMDSWKFLVKGHCSTHSVKGTHCSFRV